MMMPKLTIRHDDATHSVGAVEIRFMSHHVTWWFYRSAGKWCYYLLPLLIGTMFAPAEVVNILSPCTKCVHDLCRIPREAKKTTRQMRWWLNQLPSSRWKSWITWLAQTPSCRRHPPWVASWVWAACAFVAVDFSFKALRIFRQWYRIWKNFRLNPGREFFDVILWLIHVIGRELPRGSLRSWS